MMAQLYLRLMEAGFDANYLDHCTLLDLDLFFEQVKARGNKGTKHVLSPG